MKEKSILKFLKELGLDQSEAAIYVSLYKYGTSTVLELSRNTKIDRSKVYRRLEDMRDIGLVNEVIDGKRKSYQATGLNMLEKLLKRKEKKVTDLKEVYDDVKLYLSGNIGLNDPETKVLFYRGKDGLKQMIWNNLRSKKECVGYTYRRVSEYVGKRFVERWRDEFIRRGIRFRHIYSDYYLRSIKDLGHRAETYPDSRFQARYIPKDTLDINHQVDIYNDTVTYYNWYEGEVFGVEIYNAKIAQMQKQMFEITWKMARII